MKRRSLSRSAQLGLSIHLGYLSIAVAFGVTSQALGFPWWLPVAMSVFVFAGASQFLAVQLLATSASPPSIVIAVMMLNLRHIVMSLTLSARFATKRYFRPAAAFFVTDEVFAAVATMESPVGHRELLKVGIPAYAGWVLGTVLGLLIGARLPGGLQEAMGIALYAMFVAIIVPGMFRRMRYVVAVASAAATHVLLVAANVETGIAILLAMTVPAVVIGVLRPETDGEDMKEPEGDAK